MSKRFLACAGAAALLAGACSDDPVAGPTTITVAIDQLEDLSSGAYEGWLIFGDEKVSTGTFTSVADASMTTDRNVGDADKFVITIEPTPDTDPTPSGVIVLAGDVTGGVIGDLSFPANLDTMAGGFILRSPTDDVAKTFDLGLDLSGLEVLTDGVYEGWLIFGEEKVSTGTFTDVTNVSMSTDRDPAGADKFVVTIEPSDDTDPTPSGVIVLAGDITDTSTGTALSFPADLSTMAGGFILRSPTDDVPAIYQLDVSLDGLEDLNSGVYEGWLIFGEEKVSTGTFTSVTDVSMTTDRDPAGADKFVVTIEPSDDSDPTPSGVIVLAGDISGGGDVDLAFPIDLSSAAGGFFLRTPTDDATNATVNDEAGIWFIDPSGSMLAAGLNLPTLPSGWVYEGWAVTQGTPLTSGRFVDPAAADLASPFSDGGPPFPGEDFLTNLPASVTPPVNLADGASMVVVSVEPDIAGLDPTGDGPFAIKPLAFMVPMDHPGMAFTAMATGPVPTVTGTLSYAMVNNDEAGLWFLDIGASGPMVGLTLPTLPSGWVYEGWAVTQGTPLTSGRFTSAEGADMASPYSDGGPPFPGEDFLTNLPAGVTGPINLADGASTIVISVEPDIAGVDPTGDGPFAIKPLALAVPMDHPGATYTLLGDGPVQTVSGTLNVTVNDTNVPNDEAGLWFLEVGDNGPMVGLSLPTLPDGWVYEGWAVTQNTPLSSGRFTSAEGADSATPFSVGGPPFPGEDFLINLPASVTPPVDLTDGSSVIVISVEPDIGGVDPTGDGPFAIKPLAFAVPGDHPLATYVELDEGPSLAPTATVTTK